MLQKNLPRTHTLLITILLFFFMTGPAWAANGNITFTAPTNVPSNGFTFTCEVKVTLDSGVLGAYDVKLTFNKDVLQITSVGGGITGEFSGEPTYGSIAAANGTGVIQVLSFQGSTDAPTGTISIFQVKFTVIGEAESTSTFNMTDITLKDPDDTTITPVVTTAEVAVNNTIGGITGTVRDSGGAAITGDQIGVQVYSGTCWNSYIKTVYSNTVDGSYAIGGLTGGSYYLYTDNLAHNYVNEWWYSTGTPKSVIPCHEAQPVTASTDTTTQNIDFELDQGGTVQGTVRDGSNNPISGVSLTASFNSNMQFAASALSDTNGAYTISGLPTDIYNVSAQKTGYGTTYYGGYSDEQRRRIFVTSPDATTGIDFTLLTQGTISGTVSNSGSTGETTVYAAPFDGGLSYNTTTDVNGDYSIGHLSTGSYVVWASRSGYATPYYSGAYTSNKATKVAVASGTNTPNINLSMVEAGGIEGTVRNAQENPLANVGVYAYNDPCWYGYTGMGTSNGSGQYTISGLPPGTYYLFTDADFGAAQHYLDRWWTSGTGTGYCDQAEAVTVTAGGNTTDKDFYLAENDTAYHAPAFKYAGVFSQRNADGSVISTFYAFITGPSPVDVHSFTVAGPSGTFNLQPNVTFLNDLGLMYWAGSNSIVADGTYTFSVTDSENRTTTAQQTFAYSDAVPGIDSGTMSPAHQSYVGTTTPTLSFTRASGVAAHQVFVWDLGGKAVWYQKDITDNASSVTVPSGILQPDTPYKWWVRTKDATGINRVISETKTFFTGTKGAPDLNSGNLLTYPNTPYGSVIAGFIWGRSRNLAPWDIGYFKVTEANNPSNYFYIDDEINFIGNAPSYYFAHIRYKNPPLNDGTYNAEIEDRTNGNTASGTETYTYAPLPDFSEDSRTPQRNVYVNTNRPTFSWGALSGAGPYSYRLRIWDYKNRLRIYQSPTLTGTSFRLPEDAALPWGSSYRWQAQAWTSTANNFTLNYRLIFTVPPLATYNYTLPGGSGTVSSYRMFVVPLYLGTVADALKMMENTLGTYNPYRWRVFMYVNGQFVEINSAAIADSEHLPSSVFWIISLDQTQVPFSGGGAPSALYRCSLGSDSWQTFGLPWDSPPIELGKIGVSDGTTTRFITDTNNALTAHVVYEYTGTGPHNGYVQKGLGDTLTPGTGYFIRVYSNTDIQCLIPPDNSGGYFNTNWNAHIYNSTIGKHEKELPPAPPGE